MKDPKITEVAFQLLKGEKDTANFTLRFDDRFVLELDVSLLRMEDTKTGDVEYYDPVLKYCSKGAVAIH